MLPLCFFQSFFGALCSALETAGPIAVLGPQLISNFGAVQASYETWRRGKAWCDFKFEPDDEIFESALRSRLIVWREGSVAPVDAPGNLEFDFRTR